MNRAGVLVRSAVGAVAVVAGAVALVAAAVAGDRDCEALPDARDPSVRHDVCGAFLRGYDAEGGRAGLGLPVTDEQPVTFVPARPYGDRQIAFSRGTIYLDSATGETSVGRWESYAPLD